MRIIRTAEQYKESNNNRSKAIREAACCPHCHEIGVGYKYMKEPGIVCKTINWLECECYSCGTKWVTSNWKEY